MKRGSNHYSSFLRIALLAIGIGIAWSHAGSALLAAPPPPPPPGTIYYCNGSPSNVWSTNSSGSGKTQALPLSALNALNPAWAGNAPPLPFRQLQAGHRWWITTAQTGTYDNVINPNGSVATDQPHHDLVAVRRNGSQLDVVQLTDFYGIMTIRVAGHIGLSNDSNDDPIFSFAHFNIYDIRGRFDIDEEGTTYCDLEGLLVDKMVLPLTAVEIASGDFIPYDGSMTDEELDALLWPHVKGGVGLQSFRTSPMGDQTTSIFEQRLMIVNHPAVDVNNPIRVLWNGSAGAPMTMTSTQWSPDGLTIAFQADDGDVWTVPVSGASAPKKVLTRTVNGTTTYKYKHPVWSPDSKHLAAVRDKYSGTQITGVNLVRVPASGGTVTDLGAVSSSIWGGYPLLRWTPSN